MKILSIAVFFAATFSALSAPTASAAATTAPAGPAAPSPCTTEACFRIPQFLIPGLTIFEECVGTGKAQDILQVNLSKATSISDFDAAWNGFCGGACMAAINAIPPSLSCCVDSMGYGPTFAQMKDMCTMSTATTGRRCGAELGFLAGAACPAPTAAACGTIPTCEWVGPSASVGTCLFKGSSPSVVYDGMCSECNRNYFLKYPTGGANGVATHSAMAGVFDLVCNKVEDTYCLQQLATTGGYRGPGELKGVGPNDIANLCNPVDTVPRRCFRSMVSTISRSLRRKARADLRTCTTGVSECPAEAVLTLSLAKVLEGSAASTCAMNENQQNCLGVFGTVANTFPCIINPLNASSASPECSSECQVEAGVGAVATGCCGPLLDSSGVLASIFLSSSSANVPTRMITASVAMAHVFNFTAAALASRPFASEQVWAQLNAAADQTLKSKSPIQVLALCPFPSTTSFGQWASSGAKCIVPGVSRTYEIDFNVDKTSWAACAQRDLIGRSLVEDVVSKLGITPAQLTGTPTWFATTTDDATNGMTVQFRFRATTQADLDSIDDFVIQKEGPFYFVTAGLDIGANCAGILTKFPKGGYTPMVKATRAIDNDGDAPAPTKTPDPTSDQPEQTDKPIQPIEPSGAKAAAATVAAAVIALVALTMLAVL